MIYFTVLSLIKLSFEIGIFLCTMMNLRNAHLPVIKSKLHWPKYLKPFYIKLLISCFKIERSDLVMTSGSLRSCFPNFISFSCSRLTVTSFFFFILHSTQTSNFKIFTPEFRNIYPWISKYPEFWNIYPWIFKLLPLYFEIFTPVFRIITFVFRNI